MSQEENSIHPDHESPSPDEISAGYIALIGRPNSGKSTLMNAMLGVDLAITTPKPQTTRNQILGVVTHPDAQFCFVDTPGLHKSTRGLNRRMNSTAAMAIEEIDVICHVVDVTTLEKRGESYDLEHFKSAESYVLRLLEKVDVPVNLVVNKIDKVKRRMTLLPILEELSSLFNYAEVIPLSARQETNISSLEEVLRRQLPNRGLLFPPDMLTDKAERFLAAEFVRQAIMEQTHNEVPYAVAIEIERFEDSEKLLSISAVIHLERDGQKGIIIGKQGQKLRQIGTVARERLENFFGKKVFLETLVRVEDAWADNPKALDRFGYGEDR